MTTVLHNSTTPSVSVTAVSENNPPQLVATLVPDEQRISFWPQLPWSPVSSAGWIVCAKTTVVVSGICTP